MHGVTPEVRGFYIDRQVLYLYVSYLYIHKGQRSAILPAPAMNINEGSNVKSLQLRSTSICLAAESTLIYQIL